MKHVFIAIGGSGTKVAEALVRLVAAGFPTHKDANGKLTSAGHSLEIWRVDSDGSSGASEDLKNALDDYKKIQAYLSDGNENRKLAQSRWAMDIVSEEVHLDPVQISTENEQDNKEKSLGGILDSQHARNGQTVRSSKNLLSAFYKRKDLKVVVDRGFYQKPFIGSAIMSIYAKSLENDSTPGGQAARLTALSSTKANFFLCGSLHGGTGAAGVPVIASSLKERKDRNQGWGWRVGGCLLAPYVTPPYPPFSPLGEDEHFDETDVNRLVEQYGDKPAFEGMPTEQKQELVRQILQGFFADPDDMEARAKQGLAYYRDHSLDYFDELYLVGKPSPNKLKIWSNGGKTQRNPLNSAEVVAALAALNFFSQANTGNPNSYVIGSSYADIPSNDMRLAHLPSYKVDGTEIDPEKIFLATAVAKHLIQHQIAWENMRAATKKFAIARFYDDKENRVRTDEDDYKGALSLIRKSIEELIRENKELLPTGWSPDDSREIEKFLSDDDLAKKDVTSKLTKKFLGSEARGSVTLGRSSAKFTTQEFGEWCPEGDQFTRGEYLRHLWTEVLDRCQTQKGH